MSALTTEPQDYYVDIAFVPAQTLALAPQSDQATVVAIGMALLTLTSQEQNTSIWGDRSRIAALRGER